MKPSITDIPGIGPVAAEALAEHRIKTVYGLARSSVEKVVAVPGFSETRATRVIAAAAEMLADTGKPSRTKDTTPTGTSAAQEPPRETKGKKDKGKDKGKGKGKGKKGKKGKDKKGKKDKGKGKGKGKNKDKKKGKK